MDLIRERGATLKAALALTAAVLVVELAGGLVSGSLPLLSDAGHVLTDVFALGLAWFALAQAKRPGHKRRTYGYQRAGILAALLNAVILMVIGIGALIAFGAWCIVREAVNLLMEGAPADIDLAAVTGEIVGTDHVTGVHDLHVWALSSEETALSCHVVIDDVPLGDAEHVVRDLEVRLCGRFAIGHTTIQVESCHPCGEIHHVAGEHNHPHEHMVLTSSRPAPPRAEGSSAPPR